jgi:hypothetical protein
LYGPRSISALFQIMFVSVEKLMSDMVVPPE